MKEIIHSLLQSYIRHFYRALRIVIPLVGIVVLSLVMVIRAYNPEGFETWSVDKISTGGYKIESNQLIVLQGNTPGTVVSGPYTPMSNGVYLMKLSYSSSNLDASWNLVKNRGGEILESGMLSNHFSGVLEVPFVIFTNVSLYEVALQISYNGTGNLTVSGLSFQKPYITTDFILSIIGIVVLFLALFLLNIALKHYRVVFSFIRKEMKIALLSKIDLYFYQELLPNYLFGLTFFTVLLMSNELFFLAKYYIENNVPFYQILVLLLNLIPFLLQYSVPFGILPAYLLSMGRLSQDSEMIAMRSCGISTLRIIRPGFLFGVLVWVFSIFFNDMVVVPSNITYLTLRSKIMAQKPAVELKEKSFLTIGGYNISFDRIRLEDNVEVMYNIHVVDVNNRKTIEAEKGHIYTDPDSPGHYILKLMNGTTSEVVKSKKENNVEEDSFFVISFKYLSINAKVQLPDESVYIGPDTMSIKNLSKLVEDQSQEVRMQIQKAEEGIVKLKQRIDEKKLEWDSTPPSLKIRELEQRRDSIKKDIASLKRQISAAEVNVANIRKTLPIYNIMKLNEKFALPLAAFVFAFISLSLGMYTARSGRGEGLGLSIIIMLSYYGMKIGVNNLILKHILPPFMEWATNAVFIAIGLGLILKKIKE